MQVKVTFEKADGIEVVTVIDCDAFYREQGWIVFLRGTMPSAQEKCALYPGERQVRMEVVGVN